MSDDLQDLYCTQEETTKRIEFCISCPSNVLDVIPKCKECDCPISSLTSMSFKTCPIGKW